MTSYVFNSSKKIPTDISFYTNSVGIFSSNYFNNLPCLRNEEVIDIPFDKGEIIKEEPIQKVIDVPEDFKEKLNKLQVRLTEIGLAQDVIHIALERYAKDPNSGAFRIRAETARANIFNKQLKLGTIKTLLSNMCF